MSSENSANMSGSNSSQADSQAQAKTRNRRTNAQIAADLAEQNRPPRQSGRPIDERQSNTRGNVDMGAIQGLLSGGDEEPSDGRGTADRGPKRPGAETPSQSAPSIWEEDDDQSSNKPERGALDIDSDEDEDEKPKKKRAKSLAKFGEELGLDAAKLYDLTVAYDDGESVSLGTLKDHYREAGDLQRSRDEFEDYRTESQNEILTARQQIDGVLQRLTSVVPPEHLARAFADYEHAARERGREAQRNLREWFPEWDDASVKAKDKEKLTETLKSYGFDAREVDVINDARIIRFAVHAMRLMDRYKRLKENFQREKVPSKVPPSAKPGRRPDRNETASRQAKSGDVVGAVATLIG